jgi:CHAT domain-containing protein
LATSAWQKDEIKPSSVSLFGGIQYDLNEEEMALIATQYSDSEILSKDRSFVNDSTRSINSFSFLNGTLQEVEAISAQFKKNGIATSLFTGTQANEEQFKLLNKQPVEVIHIATHGFFNPIEKDKPSELDDFLFSGNQQFKLSPNPLLRSGVIMAGGNKAWKGNEPVAGMEDGILTAQEIADMNLFNTELVVLSACETGLGDIDNGEGVFGLQRAFKLAGVNSIIMSLWKVPDQATSEMMQLFYEKWLGGMKKQQAFIETQREMKYRYPNNPASWAGFVMVD